MRTLVLTLLFAAAPFSAGAAVNCPDQAPDQKGVLAAETAWVHALETRDAKLLDCILAPGFMEMMWNNELRSRAETMKILPKRPNNGIKLSDVKVTISGDHAIARGINTATKPDGSPLGRVKFEDMFVYRDGMWRALTAQETLLR
ncbi:MAG: nuclear transport factor 2 family protein [Rhizomicrobium sp.]